MKKLKDLLKESYVWERKFGEKLPTLASIQKKKSEAKLTETNFDKVKLPVNIDKLLGRLVDVVKSAGLNRIKRSALLYKIIDALGMSPQQLMGDIAKIKKELGEGKLNEVGKFKVSSNPYKAWQEHGDHNNKLFNDAHWAMKAIPHKKKEIKEIQQLSSKLKNLIAIVQGQAMDL